MTANLEKSIKTLYYIFSRYTGNPNMEGSPLYGNLAEWNKNLFSKPLEELTSDDLSLFLGKVITTWGDTADLKHFLPRLLELAALFDTPYDIEFLYQKLRDAGFQTWKPEEQNAIHQFNLTMWESLLLDNSEKAEWQFMDYFETLCRFHLRITDLTKIWMRHHSFSSIKHLTNYIYEKANYLFLQETTDQENKGDLKKWLLSDAVIQKLTEAFYLYEKMEIAEKISWAIKILEDEKSNRQR